MMPTHEVFSIKEIPSDNTKPRKVWRKVGVAWDHKDGRGISLQLDLVPVQFDGRLVLREPIEEAASSEEDSEPIPDDDLPF